MTVRDNSPSITTGARTSSVVTPMSPTTERDEEVNKTLLSYEQRYSEAFKPSQPSVFFFPKDNLGVVRVSDEHPKTAVTTPGDKDDPNLQLYIKESLQYFTQPKIRVQRQYANYEKETLEDSKFPRRRYEVDVEMKNKEKKPEDNNFADMTKEMAEKVEFDLGSIQENANNAQKIIKKHLTGRIMKTYDMSTSSVEYSWDGGAEKNICKREKAKKPMMDLKHPPVLIEVLKFEPKLCEKFGELEPFFIEMAVFDLANKKKITEVFSCNVNTKETLALLPDRINLDKNNTLNRAVFHIGQRTDDIVLVVHISKILQGEEDAAFEPYLKADKMKETDFNKLKKTIPDFCETLGEYRQPVCWTVIPMFEGTELKLPQKVELFHKAKGCISNENIFTHLVDHGSGAQTKKFKTFPATLILNATQIPGYKPEYKTDNLVVISNPENESAPRLHATELFEFPISPSLNFYEYFSNYLFFYPEEVNLSSRSFSSKSARNIAIRIELKENDDDLMVGGLKAICGRACESPFVTSTHTKVSYHNRSPEFNDEIKIKLPTVLTPKHHLLLAYYHIGCQKGKRGNNLLGYTVIPILQDGKLVHGKSKYPIISDFGTKFGYLSSKNMTYVDGGKQLFLCDFRAESTVYPSDKSLAGFYQALSSLVSSNMQKKVGLDNKNLDSLLEPTINNLSNVQPHILVQSLPQVFNQLLKIMCTPTFPSSQKAALRIMLALCDSIARQTAEDYTSERNELLSKYIEDKVENFSNTMSKLFKELPRLWLEIIEDSVKKRGDSAKNVHESPDAKLPLTYSWFLFELITKSLAMHANEKGILNATTKNDNAVFGEDFHPTLEKLVKILGKEIVYRASVGLNIAKVLNQNFALFLRDLLDIIDRGFVLYLIDQFIRCISHTPDSKNQEVLQEFKGIFLQIVIDYEHYIPMCLPALDLSLEQTLEPSNHFLCGILIESCIKDIVNKERVVRTRSLNIIRTILTKHEYDKRYQNADIKTKIATLYFPYFVRFLESFNQFSEVVSEKIHSLTAVIEKCKTEYNEKSNSYREYMMRNDVEDTKRPQDSRQEDQLQKMREEEEQAKKRFDSAQEHLNEEKKRIVDEKKNALISILYILKNMDRNLLRAWWNGEMNGKVSLFLNMLHMCVEVFEYPGKEFIVAKASEGIETSTTKSLSDAKNALENMYTSLDRRHRGASQVSNSLSRSKTRNFKVNRQNFNSIKSHGKTLTNEKNEEIIKNMVFWEGTINTETSLTVIDLILVFAPDLEHYMFSVLTSMESNKTFDTLFTLLLKLLQSKQSDVTVVATLSIFKTLVRGFRGIIFANASPYSEKLIKELLKLCHSAIEKIRTQATALLYYLIKINYTVSGNFTRTKIQTTVALSDLATSLDQKGINTLRNCFSIIAEYAKKDKIEYPIESPTSSKQFSIRFSFGTDVVDARRLSVSNISFPDQVQDLVQRLGKTLTDTVGFSALENEKADNEMKCDLLYRIANGYRHAPELSVTWFNNLAEQNEKNKKFVEAALCKVYMAAVVLQFMKMTQVSAFQNADYERLVNVSPALKDEKFEELRALFLEQERPIFESRCFTREGLIELLKSAIKLFNEDSYFEYSLEIYKLFMQIYEAERDYTGLRNVHDEMSKLYDYIVKSSIRLFGSYYRIYFAGKRLPDDIRDKAFVYKMPKIMRLAELIDYLKTHFGARYGADNVEIIGESYNITDKDRNSDKCFLQITSVRPYVRDPEQRIGIFENNVNISEFMWETPFTKSGKAQSDNLTEQYKKKTIVKIKEPFPSMMTRIPIIAKEEVILTPVENAIEIIDSSIERLSSVINRDPIDINALHLVLSGTLIPQVNEGIPQIVRSFLGQNESKFDEKHIKTLKTRLAKFLTCAQEGLRKSAIHSKEPQKPLHLQFEKGYANLKQLIPETDKELLGGVEQKKQRVVQFK
jgi:hypothetical protein